MKSCISPRAPALLAVVTLVAAAGCSQTTVTVLTQAPPGRTAAVDVETRTLTVTRGIAVALECTEWAEDWSGPCRDFTFALDDASLASLFPVHLDALAGQSVVGSSGSVDETTVVGPRQRTGVVLAGAAAGTGTFTVTSASAAVELTLVVEEPPAPPEEG